MTVLFHPICKCQPCRPQCSPMCSVYLSCWRETPSLDLHEICHLKLLDCFKRSLLGLLPLSEVQLYVFTQLRKKDYVCIRLYHNKSSRNLVFKQSCWPVLKRTGNEGNIFVPRPRCLIIRWWVLSTERAPLTLTKKLCWFYMIKN